MPTYEYMCTECDNNLEIYQSFTDPPLETCQTCSGRLRRVFHPVAVVFKGSGFYSTDARAAKRERNKRQGDKERAKTGEPANREAKKEGAGSKPESKSTAKSDGAPSAKKAESA